MAEPTMNDLLRAAAGYEVEDPTVADPAAPPTPEPVPAAGAASAGGAPIPGDPGTPMNDLLRLAVRGH